MIAADVRPLLPGLPLDYREIAFRAVETVLREDPVLASVVKTWRSREGHDDDLQMPGYDMLPMIALSPTPSPNEMLAIDLTKVNFAVMVQLFVPGTCSQDILGLWGAVENAIVRSKPFRPDTPGEEEVGRFLASCLSPGPKGLNRLWPAMPGFLAVDITRPSNDPAYQVGVGSLHGFIVRPA